MDRLADAAELLDGPIDPDLLAGNLRDLCRVNRWFGGVDISRRAIADLRPAADPGRVLRVLDIGTGAADIPAALVVDPGLEVLATDVRPEIVAAADRLHGGRPRLRIALAAGSVGGERSTDIAHASLVLHHLGPEAALAMLGRMAGVAPLGVVINDLDRTRRGWLGAWLTLHAMTRNRYTLHDGPLSVRRAWRPSEIVAMAATVGLEPVSRHDALLHHRYAIAFRHARVRA